MPTNEDTALEMTLALNHGEVTGESDKEGLAIRTEGETTDMNRFLRTLLLKGKNRIIKENVLEIEEVSMETGKNS